MGWDVKVHETCGFWRQEGFESYLGRGYFRNRPDLIILAEELRSKAIWVGGTFVTTAHCYSGSMERSAR
jgi:hypothetical protein